MAYTPELSLRYSGMLRRVAWAANVPMTKALEDLVRLLPVVFNAGKVCAACKDVTFCQSCGFAQNNKGGDETNQAGRGSGRRAGVAPAKRGQAHGCVITQPEPDINVS